MKRPVVAACVSGILVAFLIPTAGVAYLWRELQTSRSELQAAMSEKETELRSLLASVEDRLHVAGGQLDSLVLLVRATQGEEPEGSIAVGNGLQNLVSGATTQGQWNTAVGVNSLLNSTTGWAQTAVGFNALRDSGKGEGPVQTGVFGNTAVGYNSMAANSEGYDNTAVGTNTLLNNQTGDDNSALGINALRNNRTGSDNTAVGFDALMNMTDGHQNVAIGGMAGRFLSEGDALKTRGSDSIYIGFQAYGGTVNNARNEIVIGAGAHGQGSNTVVLGNDEIEHTYLKGVVHLDDGTELTTRRIPHVTIGLAAGKVLVTGDGVEVAAGAESGTTHMVYNDSDGPIVLSQGDDLALRLAGTDSVGDISIPPRGFATIWFNSSDEAIATGYGLLPADSSALPAQMQIHQP